MVTLRCDQATERQKEDKRLLHNLHYYGIPLLLTLNLPKALTPLNSNTSSK